jgi:AraC-like DNA-binding protein
VAPNQPHALQAEGAVSDLFFVEPGFKAFQEMAQLADASGLQQGLLVLDPSLKSKITLEALQGWETNSGSAETPGDRVAQAVRWIQQHPRDAAFSLADLAREVHLSPSRLSHLFKAQMGVSIQKYAIWNRMKTAVDLVVKQEMDLTQAAYAAGFYDLAHFSKHFKEMFGVTPSLVYNNSRIVQVYL